MLLGASSVFGVFELARSAFSVPHNESQSDKNILQMAPVLTARYLYGKWANNSTNVSFCEDYYLYKQVEDRLNGEQIDHCGAESRKTDQQIKTNMVECVEQNKNYFYI